MPLPVGGFLSALGAAYQGYGQDQDARFKEDQLKQQATRQSALDQDTMRMHGAEIQNYKTQADQASAQLAEQARLHTAEIDNYKAEAAKRDAEMKRAQGVQDAIRQHWGAAIGGNKDSQGQISAVAPQLASLFEPKPTQDEWVETTEINPETGHPYLLEKHSGRRLAGVGELAPKGGAGGGGNALAKDREMRVKTANDMASPASARMGEFEDGYVKGDNTIGGLDSILAAIGRNFDPKGIGPTAAQVTALTVLQHTNPALAQYVRDGLNIAYAEASTSSRPSNFRAKMGEFLAQGSAGATPEMMATIRQSREAVVNNFRASAESYNAPTTPGGGRSAGPAGRVTPPGSGVAPGATSGRAPLSSSQKSLAKTDAGFATSLKAQGYTDADWR